MTIKKVVYLNTIFIILILTIAGVLVIWEMTREVAPPISEGQAPTRCARMAKGRYARKYGILRFLRRY